MLSSRWTWSNLVLIAIVLLMAAWFIFALDGRSKNWIDPPMPTWQLDIAALSPLVVLIRFRRPEVWKRSGMLDSDVRIVSGLYFAMALLGALAGHPELWLGVAFGVAGIAGFSYLNRRAERDG
ncbi:hypothetical protein ACIQNU_20785 [Streptomyces sp. NPDC091292]|uniref:hypothetical protein n=1 Tax=Streptomyces sp. NPDC091292 TaxID=3365991 RepID=UPI0037FF6D32